MECKIKTKSDFIILVTGMVFEAHIANIFGKNIKAVVSGGSTFQLENKILDLISQGGKAIISYGIAGGLRENLKPGAIVIGSSVITSNTHILTHAGWTSYLIQRLPGSVLENVLGVERPVIHSSQKKLLELKTGAGIIDMESHIAARTAQDFGIPCVVLRVVLDDVNRDIPEVAAHVIRTNGKIDILGLLQSTLLKPREFKSLIRLCINAVRAFWSLLRCNRLLGKGFGFFDL